MRTASFHTQQATGQPNCSNVNISTGIHAQIQAKFIVETTVYINYNKDN